MAEQQQATQAQAAAVAQALPVERPTAAQGSQVRSQDQPCHVEAAVARAGVAQPQQAAEQVAQPVEPTTALLGQPIPAVVAAVAAYLTALDWAALADQVW